MKKLLILLLILSSVSTYAQKKKERNVCAVGVYQLPDNLSKEQAKIMALKEAKSQALVEAGVPMSVWSFQSLISSNEDQNYNEGFSEFSTTFIDGMMKLVMAPIYRDTLIGGMNYVSAKIYAVVNVDNIKEDKSFIINVENINSIYENGELMNFTVSFYGFDAFLNIFWFDASGGAMIYPTQRDNFRSMCFKKDFKYTFPKKGLSYTLRKESPATESESIFLIVVASKKEYPFLLNNKQLTYKNIAEWLYEIPSDERRVFLKQITVR